MTVGAAQSERSKRVATAVVAAALRSFAEITTVIKAFFRTSDPVSVEQRTESAAETKGVTTFQVPADTEVEVDAGTGPTAHRELGQQEIERRRSLVRAFFNDFWSGTQDKPAAFVQRLDEAEDYLNERLTANGETWRLDAETRIMLGLPPRSS
jgi:hypothetical protein